MKGTLFLAGLTLVCLWAVTESLPRPRGQHRLRGFRGHPGSLVERGDNNDTSSEESYQRNYSRGPFPHHRPRHNGSYIADDGISGNNSSSEENVNSSRHSDSRPNFRRPENRTDEQSPNKPHRQPHVPRAGRRGGPRRFPVWFRRRLSRQSQESSSSESDESEERREGKPRRMGNRTA